MTKPRTTPDPLQLERLRPFLEHRACVVVGSAPLPTPYAEVQHADECVIAVNGGISSLPPDRVADVWFVGSKLSDGNALQYRPMHALMLEQARKRTVGHIVLLRPPDRATEAFTLAQLDKLKCRYGSWSCFDKPLKRHLEGELCGRVDDKQPCSSGILATACALSCGAASVRLVGFSLKPGYAYLPNERNPPTWWRDHVHSDARALNILRARYGDTLSGDLVEAVAA